MGSPLAVFQPRIGVAAAVGCLSRMFAPMPVAFFIKSCLRVDADTKAKLEHSLPLFFLSAAIIL